MSDVTSKVLFVCTGNTCRSPMAEGLFQMVAEGEGFEVSSAGVAAHDGSQASPETVEILRENGIVLENFRSRMVNEAMLEEADAVFCMTESHLIQLERMFPEHEEKYHLACDFLEINGVVGADVPDPIGMGPAAYHRVAEVLEAGMEGILGYLKTRKMAQE